MTTATANDVRLIPAYVTQLMNDLKASGRTFSGEQAEVDVSLAALTRQEFQESIEVPVEFGDEDMLRLIDIAWNGVDGGEYLDDPNFWEKGNCSWTEAGGAKTTVPGVLS